jgi:hypothetical protein
MKMNEKIFNYIAGRLSEKEKFDFEKELEKNEELKKQFDMFSLQLNKLTEANDINFNPAYFVNLLPRTREKLYREKKKILFPKLALALPVLAIIVYFLFYSNRTDVFSKYVADLPDSSKQEIVSYIDSENNNIQAELMKESNADELLDKAISNSIDIQNINVDSRFTYSDDYELLKKLSPEEANKIYNNLVDKKIL